MRHLRYDRRRQPLRAGVRGPPRLLFVHRRSFHRTRPGIPGRQGHALTTSTWISIHVCTVVGIGYAPGSVPRVLAKKWRGHWFWRPSQSLGAAVLFQGSPTLGEAMTRARGARALTAVAPRPSVALPGNDVAVLIGERSRRAALLQRETNRVLAAFLHREHPSVVVEVGGDEPR